MAWYDTVNQNLAGIGGILSTWAGIKKAHAKPPAPKPAPPAPNTAPKPAPTGLAGLKPQQLIYVTLAIAAYKILK